MSSERTGPTAQCSMPNAGILMPDQPQGQKQTHGGDDTGGAPAPAPVKKISLTKYASLPDMNIRDVFWRIISEYAEKKGRGVEVQKYEGMRAALIRIALSVLEKPESAYHGLSSSLTAIYTVIMVLDGGWEDMFQQLLEESASFAPATRRPIVKGMQRLLQIQRYRLRIQEYLSRMIKDIRLIAPVMLYLVEIGDVQLIQALKKWIMVIAQTDIETNQIYAISALSVLENDHEVRQLYFRLLTHWDPETRKAIATVLARRTDEEVIREAEMQIPLETNPEVLALLKKIVAKKPSTPMPGAKI